MKMIKQPTIPPMPKQPTFDARDTQYNLPIGTELISRQAAIEALENDKAALDKIIKGMSAEDMLLKYYVAQHNQVSYDIDAIVQLPPANNSEIPNSSDTISRQAAIEALCDEYCGGWQDCKYYPKCENLKAIQNLPPVQPERTCVNCGRTANNGGWYADGGTRCPIEEHYALPKDGYCHLWEKRNVTDDDYPERRTDE